MQPNASDTRRRDHVLRTPLAVLSVALLAPVLAACGTADPSPPIGVPSTAEGPCAAAGARLSPTTNAALLRASQGLPLRQAPFSVSLVPTVPVPIRIGTELGFQLSSGTAGYASLYIIDPAYDVQVLAENLPVPAGSLEYPSSQGFSLRAAEPVGFNRAVLLVTRQPFGGFSGNDTLTTPVATALDGRTFVSQLNDATRALPGESWVADEVCLRIVG